MSGRIRVQRFLIALTIAALTLGIWELSICTPSADGVGSCDGRLFVLFSKPSDILAKLADGDVSSALLLRYSAVTAINASAALLLAAAFAIVWYWFGTRHRAIRQAGYAFVWFFQVVPYVAFAWIFSILFGGLDKAVFGFLVAVFPLIGALLTGLRSMPDADVEIMTLYRASHIQKMQHLYFPLAAPYFFGGLAVAAPLAVVGAMIADLSGGSSAGLGREIFTAVRNAEPAELWACTLAAVVISLALCAVVWAAEVLFSHANRWYPTEELDVST